MLKIGEALVNAIRVTNGFKVLDLGCGNGTTAIPEAKCCTDMRGVNIAANLVVARKQTRALHSGLSDWRPEREAPV